ncbi:DUF882 domain-containing protein [Mesorhizobium sp. RMAD-H1]|uniref:DUF882 domain-containing protein n=1 Tax=Mesorhizobium sp. RMAD-H1 TaxID=2587065 RepID=UPI00160AF31F|nr:DUF882 domain-containing protein [Mesorhizobium sp. RMAD-H1]MBB2973754.1 uncharacterized protein YcbK (DUF882 family) [Mesorhizobium sp. RMAD-H1]
MNCISAFKAISAAALARRLLWIALLVAAPLILAASDAAAETRTLKVYFVHTKERAEITFKKNGRYIPSGLAQLNRFLRDWRRNEPTKMDPRLFDLVWQVYQASGSRDYIHVVSAYRSPATNSMLRSRSRGVAKKSQHMLGRAMDFYIPDVPLKKLRAIGMRYQAGGVGYYPTSGSPFVHMDVGNVRHWPRMSRRELLALFPDGKTLHVPTDGKPLPGYEQALAAYEARQARGGSVAVASAPRKKSKTLFAALFGGGADEEEDTSEASAPVAVASAARPSRAVPRAPVAEEVPVRAPAPQPQPEPQPQPATIVAALPPREVPRPLDAPRPAAALAEGTPQPEAQAALAFAVPVPGRRPETALAMVTPPADVPTPPANVPAGGTDAVNAAVDANSARIADAGVPSPMMNGFVPVPLSKPKHVDPGLLLAAAVVPEQRPETGAALAAAEEAPAAVPEPKRDEIAAVVEANLDTPAFPLPQNAPPRSPQVALADPKEPGTSPDMVASVSPASISSPRKVLLDAAAKGQPINAIDTGVRTTAKGAKPHPGATREPEAIVQPAKSVPLPQMALSSTSVARAVPATSPVLRNDALRTAPTTVYTAGFQRELTSDKANRFSGSAVTFLSIAKFSETN